MHVCVFILWNERKDFLQSSGIIFVSRKLHHFLNFFKAIMRIKTTNFSLQAFHMVHRTPGLRVSTVLSTVTYNGYRKSGTHIRSEGEIWCTMHMIKFEKMVSSLVWSLFCASMRRSKGLTSGCTRFTIGRLPAAFLLVYQPCATISADPCSQTK